MIEFSIATSLAHGRWLPALLLDVVYLKTIYQDLYPSPGGRALSSSLPVFFLPKRFLLVAALSLALSTMGYGRTITVMQNGSGDFVEIQPALDAAASGDSILVGPGIYTEMNNYYLPGNGGWVDVGAYVQVENISIIGSGPEATVIGPTVYEPIDQGPKGIVHLVPGKIVVKDLAIRHYVHGIFLVESMVDVDNCQFHNNFRGILGNSMGMNGKVFNSQFVGSDPVNSIGIAIFGSGQDIEIVGCSFDSHRLELQSVRNIVVKDCQVFGSVVGAQVDFGAEVTFENCQFFEISNVGMSVRAKCVLSNCTIEGDWGAVVVSSYGALDAFNSSFIGGDGYVLQLSNVWFPSQIRFSHLIKNSSSNSVDCWQGQTYGSVRHDLRGNYWGTDDGDQIATWILDGHDDPQIRAEVLYTPFATGDSDLVVSLAPQDSPIIIPETGGSFLYDASIENNTATDIVADLTIEAVLPDGTAYPVMDLPRVVLAGASVRTRIGIVQEVPGAAPAGTYTYRVSASLGDTLLVDTAELPFEKVGGGMSAAAGPMSWPVTGWLDEDRPPFQGGALKPVLFGPVPNPFNPTTTVAFELPAQEAVSLHVFDLQGRLVRTLLNGEVVPQGRHEAVWDGRDASGRQAASGTYFFRLEAGGQAETKRAVLVK